METTQTPSRLDILSAIGRFADGSLPPEETVRRLLDLAVPALADACMVDSVAADGTPERLGVRVHGPGGQQLEEAFAARPLTSPDAPRSETRTLLTGESQLFEVTEELMQAAAHGPEDLELLHALEMRQLVIVPLLARGRTVGALTFCMRGSGRRFTPDDQRFVEVLSGRLALALDNARLRAEAAEVEQELAVILSTLADAVTVQDSSGAVVYANQAAADLMGFASPAELLATGGRAAMDRFLVMHEDGRPVSVDDLPGRRVLAGEEPEPLVVRNILRETGEERWSVTKATPIRDESGRVIMAVNVIEDVTAQKQAEFGQRLLAQASDVLASSLDYERTLREVARLAVPELADWCAFDLRDGRGGFRLVAVEHTDRQKVEQALSLRERYPADPEAETGLSAVMRTGKPEIYDEIGDEMLAQVARDPEHLELLRSLGFSSVLIVPVTAGREVLGALTLVASESRRRFGEADLRLAEELGRRAGTAVQNSRIFSERSEIARTLQSSLLPPRLPDVPGWDITSMFRPAGEANEVGGDFYDVFPASGAWYALIGDVAGKGAAAAALTSLARYTLRAAIALSGDTGLALRELNALLRERSDLALCSVACARLGDDWVEVACAGHPRPLRVRAGAVETLGEIGPMLGAVDERDWPVVRAEVQEGDGLLLYTDGVLDTVGDGARFGEERIHEALTCGNCSAPELIQRLADALDSFRRGPQPDDTAALALVRGGGRLS